MSNQSVFTVYKTTNLVNGKIYIGVHKTKDPNDAYLGSGKLILLAIEKYGKENFKKEVLFLFQTQEEAYAMEGEIASKEFSSRDDTYNLIPGGVMGSGWYRDRRGTKNPLHGRIWVWHPDLGSKTILKDASPEPGWKLGRPPEMGKHLSEVQIGSKHSEEAVANMRRNRKGKCVGEDHPNFGKVILNKGGRQVAASSEDVPSLLKDGWRRGNGRRSAMTGCSHSESAREKMRIAKMGAQDGPKNHRFGVKEAWICKSGERSKKILLDHLSSYLLEGWQRGRVPRP